LIVVLRVPRTTPTLGVWSVFIFAPLKSQASGNDPRLKPDIGFRSTSKKGKESWWPDTHLSLTNAANCAANVRARVCRGTGKDNRFQGPRAFG